METRKLLNVINLDKHQAIEEWLSDFDKCKEDVDKHLGEVPKSFEDSGDVELGLLKQEIEKMGIKTHTLLDYFLKCKQENERELFEKEKEKQAQINQTLVEFKAQENRLNEIVLKFTTQETQLKRAQAEIMHLKKQIEHQTTYCAGLGSVLGTLIWRASRSPQILDTWLPGNKIDELLSIANEALVSFINTYGTVFPPVTTDVSQFIMSLLGVVSNISSTLEGRQFIVTNPNGITLIQIIVKQFPNIPMSSGSPIKRLMLILLYNTSINKTGFEYLYDLQIGESLKHCLEDSMPREIQLLSLKLLNSLTCEYIEEKNMIIFLKSIKIEMLHSFKKSIKSDTELILLVEQVIQNLHKWKEAIDAKINNVST